MASSLVYFNEDNALKYDKFVMNFTWKISKNIFIKSTIIY